MKVLIVDDEKHVRNSVRMLVDWQALNIEAVLEAGNGLEAVRLIEEERPQLVITDIMMPLKSGVELMEWLNACYPDCKKIVISGHNDFEFVRQTMKYGGTDYLLKPIVQKQLQDAIKKAIDSWTEADQNRMHVQSQTMEFNQLKTIYRDKLISNSIIEPVGYSSELALLIKEFPGLQQVKSCRVALLRFEYMERSLREKFVSDRGLLVFSLINICNEIVQAADCGIAFRNLNSKYEIGLLLWDRLEEAEAMMAEINRGIEAALKARFDIGIGIEMPFPHSLKEAYKQAQKALRQRNLLDRVNRIQVYRPVSSMIIGTLRFSEFEQHVSLAMISGRIGQIEAALQEWFNLLDRMETITTDQLDLWLDEFTVLQARWIEEIKEHVHEPGAGMELSSAHTRFVIPVDDEGHFSLSLFRQKLTHHLNELMRVLVSQRVQYSHSMNEIAKYIQLNYAENITLGHISDKFHLNREYISRKFKQELHENVIDFLNRVRIEKSKVLLLNPQMRISEVASKVGNQDEKYFSRVFKKLEGRSPKDYRVLRNEPG
ncbi:response regulator [Paenibacillus piri]|uniref:Response regulator n=1 Tax=Paenibacillus piri TaxID=2547395 RepID=A0A4R5KVE5_9BACL|nr:response regulator [Paenibacillus piri]TDF99472.1 response regulator [Paenibacillus piri]